MIHELVNNQENNEFDCQKVLGSLESLHKITNLWEECAKEIHIIGLSEELEWRTDKEFDSKELNAFKEGLAAIPLFMQRCSNEVAIMEEMKNNKDIENS